jgi:RNA polymerase sigma factor (sigma-70 family)
MSRMNYGAEDPDLLAATDEELCAFLTHSASAELRPRTEGELHRRYFARLVHALTKRFDLELADAEEIANDSIRYLLQTPEKFDRRRGTVGAFLWTVASRDALNYLDRIRRTHLNGSLGSAGSRFGSQPYAGAPDWINAKTRRWMIIRRVRRAVRVLPPRMREVVEMSAQGLSNHEIAELLSVGTGAVRTALSQARKRVTRTLE